MKRILLFLEIFVFLCGNAFAQNDFNFVGAGGRQAGLGFAFIGLADDATAITSNPAGLAKLRKAEFSIEGAYWNQKSSNEAWKNGASIGSSKNNTNSIRPDFGSFIIPVKTGERNLVFGVSYQTQMDYTYKGEVTGDTYIQITDNNTKINTISFGTAYTILPYFSIGLTLNKWFSYGNRTTQTIYTGSNPYPNVKNYDKSKYHGINFVSGLLFDFGLLSTKFPLKIGLKLNTPFNLSEDSKLEITSDLGTASHSGKFKKEFPYFFGGGLSYKIGDYFTIGLDFESRKFKNTKYTYSTFKYYTYGMSGIAIFYGDTTYSGNVFRLNKNLNQVRLGVEYIFHPKTVLVPVRLGFKTNPTESSNYLDDKPTGQIYAKSINTGIGLTLKRFSFDFAYERIFFSSSYDFTDPTDRVVFNDSSLDNVFYFSTIIYF